jgi:hypothetical protein
LKATAAMPSTILLARLTPANQQRAR